MGRDVCSFLRFFQNKVYQPNLDLLTILRNQSCTIFASVNENSFLCETSTEIAIRKPHCGLVMTVTHCNQGT